LNHFSDQVVKGTGVTGSAGQELVLQLSLPGLAENPAVNDIARLVQQAGANLGLQVQIEHIPNPRLEAEEHYYNPAHCGLTALGLEPHNLTEEVLCGMLRLVQKYRENIQPHLIHPKITWDSAAN
jgi:UDP-sulfoquinovose synthase